MVFSVAESLIVYRFSDEKSNYVDNDTRVMTPRVYVLQKTDNTPTSFYGVSSKCT